MKRVITYGTFDLFHIGHYNILKRAKEYGDYLIVGVTGENYDAERGKLSVQDSLSKRIENVKKTGFADKIIVEEYLGQKISDIIKYNVDVFVIGSDWKGKFDHLSKYCEIKYLERTKDISSTKIRNEKLNIYKFGIVTDSLYDQEAVVEPKSVSGIHVESVFSEDKDLAEEFALKYELDKSYSNYDEFLKNIDIVYIKSSQEKRERYSRAAIENKKHVICDVPVTMDIDSTLDIVSMAKKNSVVFLDNISMLYLQSFEQLSWMVRGNIIGDIVSLKCCISKGNFNDIDKKTIAELAYYPLCAVMRLLGNDFYDCVIKTTNNGDSISYVTIELLYENTTVFIEIGAGILLEDGMIITGTEGSIFVPDNWWNIGYFKMKKNGENKYRRYSFNFEGNGFRYIIRTLLNMIRDNTYSAQRLTIGDYKTIILILKKLLDSNDIVIV